MSPWDLSEWQLREPLVLWALLLLPVLLVLRERATAGVPPWRSFGAMVLRGLAFVALVLAMAQPFREVERPDRSVVFVVDASASLDSARAEAATEWLRAADAARGDAEARWVVAGARLETRSTLDGALSAMEDRAPAAAGTDLRSALEVGLASLPPARHREVVLLSDGAATRGRIDDAVRVAEARDLPVHVVPLGPSSLRAGIVQAVPEQDAALGERATVAVDLVANAAVAGELLLTRDGAEVDRQAVAYGPGTTSATLSWAPNTSGLSELRVELVVEGDPLPEDDVVDLRVRVRGSPRALVVGAADAASALRAAVSGHRPPLQVTTESALPTGALDDWELIVLLDPDLPSLPAGRHQALRDWVRAGGRLLVTGGERGLVTDEPNVEPLAEILPVRFPKTKKQEQAPLAVVYALDRSDSMAGSAKFELAATGLAQSLQLLPDEARVGILGFSDLVDVVLPLQLNPGPEAAVEALRKVRIQGGTDIFSALTAAFTVLKDDDALVKHVVLLSDGQSTTSFSRHGDIVNALLRRKITVTTIAVSRDSDRQEMERIAEAGGGRSHYAERFRDLPKLFLDELMTVTRTNKVETDFEVLPVAGSPLLADLGEDPVIPNLVGYVRGEQRAGSQLALATADGHPVLVQSRHGRGVVTLLTTDVGGPWSIGWGDWDEHRELWSGTVAALLFPEPSEHLALRTSVEGDRAWVEYDAVDPLRNPRGDLLVEALVDDADGRRAVALPPVGPGRYGAALTLAPGASLLRVAAVGTTSPDSPPPPGGELLASVQPAPPEEVRAATRNPTALEAVARATGGQVDPAPPAIFEREVGQVIQQVDRWPYPLFAALVLLLLDLAWRRVRRPG